MTVDVQEAIKNSLLTEKSAMLFYQYGAQQFKDHGAKRTFELLASEEREHAGHFHRIYPGSDIPSLDEFLAIQASDESTWLAVAKKVCGAEFTEQKALEVALNKEKQLEEALRELAVRMDDPEVRAVYELNACETHKHYLLIEAEYARIMGMVDESDMDTFVRE
ncbi:ferritin family protein [Geobacter pelophilus]|uniref:Ferritin family protein n=1 Tax=Geoanaerobacter pelophilus TaxID=60036 RepID=A0AAW4L6D0_9BACT|nr:ferritin family protein [Geoanaerobacter pelophilus]MBT0664135.1 ferritin family protein [Geoanaerobacter pelophilus]